MTSQEIRLLAIRLFGLYQGIVAAQFISELITYAVSYGADFNTNLHWTVSSFVHGAACFLCLTRTERIANWVFADLLADESTPTAMQRPFSMAFLVVLLALYFIVRSTGLMITAIATYILDASSHWLYQVWGSGATFILGLLLLIGATFTERLITGRSPLLEESPEVVTKHEDTHAE